MNEELACDIGGRCTPHPDAKGGITNCVHCGKELVKKEDGMWYTWDADFFSRQAPQY